MEGRLKRLPGCIWCVCAGAMSGEGSPFFGHDFLGSFSDVFECLDSGNKCYDFLQPTGILYLSGYLGENGFCDRFLKGIYGKRHPGIAATCIVVRLAVLPLNQSFLIIYMERRLKVICGS